MATSAKRWPRRLPHRPPRKWLPKGCAREESSGQEGRREGGTGRPTPLKDKFTKASLATHIAERAAVEVKAVKAVLVALENVVLKPVHKKGAGEFTLPGLLKITAQVVPAKKKRFGKDPFTGEERWFPAKPASVRVKARALKKLKDAAA